MSEFCVGQRWLSEPEPGLGLGIIQDVDYRLIKVFFPASEEERTYARQNAPLSRLSYQVGDRLESDEGEALVVAAIEELQGVLVYQVHPEDAPDDLSVLPEMRLGHRLDLSGATDRLFAKQLDRNGWFELRHAALQARAHVERSPVQGLLGPRIDLIGHQLYIAHQVASRYAPRVLLADEVGLGKTIEAGLILHHQILTERARRILIVVPETLIHQWLVEMLRRFNLHFKIFDQNRCDDLSAENNFDNIFYAEKFVLCSLDFVVLHANFFEQVVMGLWELMVGVDD